MVWIICDCNSYTSRSNSTKMKLLFCPDCKDVKRLHFNKTYCKCKKSWGRYINEIDAVINSNAIPLGFDNPSLAFALGLRPMEGRGRTFDAFVIPKKCQTISVEGEKE